MKSALFLSGLAIAQKKIYEPAQLLCSQIVPALESQEYGACTFIVNNKRIIFRVAKITPTKIGQFVTFWKRINGVTVPYDAADNFDLFVVNVSKQGHFGQFVFSKEILRQHGVISVNGAGGKRALRVYPAWDIPDNKQAQKTQVWQSDYFFETSDDPKSFNRDCIQKLYF